MQDHSSDERIQQRRDQSCHKKNKAIFLFRLYILLLFQGKKDKTYFQIDVLNFRDRTLLQSKREVEFAPDDLKNIVELNVQEEKRSR